MSVFPAIRRDQLTDRPRAPQRRAASQFLKESAGLTIDQIAVIAISASTTLRDIVARKPGVTQDPRTTIVPNRAIRINRTIIWSNSFISISLNA